MNRNRKVCVSVASQIVRFSLAHFHKVFLGALLLSVLQNPPVWAGLGQPEASISADQQELKGQDQVRNLQGYRVHQLTTSGMVVREYVSPRGSVFGISWHGRSTPNMSQLLAAYVTILQTATPAQTHIRHLRGLTVKTDDFVYSNVCVMRMCSGSAYVLGLVPSNVSTQVIR